MEETGDLYPYSREYAVNYGELEAWRKSHRKNKECADAIALAIRDHYANNHLDTSFVQKVIDQYGEKRTHYVLASIVQHADWDRRYTNKIREWAAAAKPQPQQGDIEGGFGITTHPGLLNLFAEETMKIQKEREQKIEQDQKQKKPRTTQYDKVKELTDKLEAGVAELFESEKYKNWLKTMSKFHDYSLSNQLLINMQKHDVSLVAGYTTWQKLGRQVQKDEKAIKIIAPSPYKKTVEREKTDPDTGEILYKSDGTIRKEMQEVIVPAFRVVNVFDISQTQGKELPILGVSELEGSTEHHELFMQAIQNACPVPITFEEIQNGAKGFYHLTEERICIQKDMSDAQTEKTAIHEWTHQRLHSRNTDSNTPAKAKNTKEIEAESVAFVVCQHNGVDTSDYSFPYIAAWACGKEMSELRESMDTIRITASEMISDLDREIAAIRRERHQDLNRTQTIEEPSIRTHSRGR